MMDIIKKLLSKLFFFIIVALLFSCEGQTNYYKSVSNNSGDTICLKVFSQYVNMIGTDTFTIIPGKEQLIFHNDQRGGNSFPVSCSLPFDSIRVNISGGKILTKDILDDNSWELDIESSKRGSLVDQRCLFLFTDEDLQ